MARSRSNDALDVLYEDNHLLVVNKPAGLATQGGTGRDESLVELAREYVKRKYAKPGNVFLGIVSRLDAAVSGVIVLARTSKAAARLTEQFRERQAEKLYWAVVEGSPPEQWTTWTDWLAKDERLQRMVVFDAPRPGAQEARLAIRRLKSLGSTTLVEIRLETGRKHQIRVQLAARGMPVVGDVKYGSTRKFADGIALCSKELALDHPTRGERMEFTAPVPQSWKALGVAD